MNTSCLRLKLVELTSLQVFLLTIRVIFNVSKGQYSSTVIIHGVMQLEMVQIGCITQNDSILGHIA